MNASAVERATEAAEATDATGGAEASPSSPDASTGRETPSSPPLSMFLRCRSCGCPEPGKKGALFCPTCRERIERTTERGGRGFVPLDERLLLALLDDIGLDVRALLLAVWTEAAKLHAKAALGMPDASDETMERELDARNRDGIEASSARLFKKATGRGNPPLVRKRIERAKVRQEGRKRASVTLFDTPGSKPVTVSLESCRKRL